MGGGFPPHSNYRQAGKVCACSILLFFCLVLSGARILCTQEYSCSTLEKEDLQRDETDEEIKGSERRGDRNAEGTGTEDCYACAIAGRKSYNYSGFGALPSYHAHGMLSRHVRAQPFGFRTRTKARQSRWDHLPLRRILVSSVADRTGSRFTQLSLQVPMRFDLPSGKIFVLSLIHI